MNLEFAAEKTRKMLKKKAEIEQLDKCNVRLDEMPTRKEVKQIRTDLFGSMEKFNAQND